MQKYTDRNDNMGGRVVSASGSEACVTSSMPTSAIIYDAYTSIKKKKKKKTLHHLTMFFQQKILLYMFFFYKHNVYKHTEPDFWSKG